MSVTLPQKTSCTSAKTNKNKNKNKFKNFKNFKNKNKNSDMVRVQYLFLGGFQSPAIARCRFSKVLQLPGVRVSKVLQLPGVKFSKVLQLPGVGFFGGEKVGVEKW